MEEVPGSEKFFPAQLVFLALGFLGPEQSLPKAAGLDLDGRGNIKTPVKVTDEVPRQGCVTNITNLEILDQCSGNFRCRRLSSRPIPHCLGY